MKVMFVLRLVWLAALLASHAHSRAADIGEQNADLMVSVLTRSTGWSAQWSGPGGSGVTEIIFERQGDKLFAKISLISPYSMSCENPAIVAQNTVTFDGCRDPSVTLAFFPNDPIYPFQGRSPRGYEWKLREK